MIQEQKQLLLIDLCARLPYGVMCKLSVKGAKVSITEKLETGGLSHFIYGTMDVKPYLRPMSSMTEEERKYLQQHINADFVDYCNEHHLDFRGLIQMDLGVEALKGMYEEAVEGKQ